MNSENIRTSELYKILFNLADKISLKKSDKYPASSNHGMYFIWKNINNSCRNNKSKISAPRRNWKFEFLDRTYSVSDIQDYF